MNDLFFILVPLLFLVVLIYGVYRAVGRLWLERRIRLALLEQAQMRPERLDAFQEAGNVVARTLNQGAWGQQDYLVTGVLLGLMGIASGAAGLYLHAGRMAVGLYVGGYACVSLGVLIAVTGAFVGLTARHSDSAGKP